MQEHERSFHAILGTHLTRYPLMQAQDIYKLAHQAALGSEHAVQDAAAARAWLERELAEMGNGPAEPLMEPISPDGQIVRVHLRPFVQSGGDPQALLEAFVRTANEYQGDRHRLEDWLLEIAQVERRRDAAVKNTAYGLQTVQVRRLGLRLRAQGYPAVHHSAAYQAAYRPAYRVVRKEFLRSK